MTDECLEELLLWLDTNRDRGAEKYEQIRSRLIRICIYRRFIDAEEMADVTINRVARKARWLRAIYQGDSFPYFKRDVDFVCLERSKWKPEPLPEVLPDKEAAPVELELNHKCL